MNWGDMKNAARKHLHRDDLEWDMLQGLAWAEVGQKVETAETLAFKALPLAVSADFAGARQGLVPDDFGHCKAVRVGSRNLMPTDIFAFWENRDGGVYVHMGEMIHCWEQGASMGLIYCRVPPNLTSDSSESVLMRKYPNLMVSALCLVGSRQIQDAESISLFDGQFNEAVELANYNAAYERLAPGKRPNIQGGE